MGRTPDPEAQIELYFATVSDALQGLTAEHRAEILADLRAHLKARQADGNPTDVRRLLAELGDPADIAAQAGVSSAPVAPVGDGVTLAAIVLTVLAWPIGLVVAAFSGRWRLSALVYAGLTPLVGWAAGIIGGAATLTVQSAPQVSNCQVPVPGPGSPPFHVVCGLPGATMTLPLRGLASGDVMVVLFGVGFVGAPIAAAIYLAQTRRRPDARPWLPGAVITIIVLSMLAAYLGARMVTHR